MKKVIFGTLFLGLIGLGIVGCKKENVAASNPMELNKELGKNKNNTKSLFEIGNTNNPFDFNGINHNDMLISFIEEVLIGTNIPNPFVTGTFNDYNFVFDYFDSDDITKHHFSFYINKCNLELSDYDGLLLELYKQNPYPFHKYHEVRSVLLDSSLPLKEKITRIRIFENNLLNEPIDDDLKEVLLITSSIARWSAYLWAPKSEGGLGYYNVISPNADPEVVAISWPDVVVSDVFGAATAAFGTANPFVALGWGAVSSALDAGRQYFD